MTFIEKCSIIEISIDAVEAEQTQQALVYLLLILHRGLAEMIAAARSFNIDSTKGGNIMQNHIPHILAERIVCDENILTGKPVIKGTRLAVEFIIGLLGHGWTEVEILENYPHIVQEDIRACLAYASAVLRTQKDYQHLLMKIASV